MLGTSWIAGRVGDAARGADARPRYGRFFERQLPVVPPRLVPQPAARIEPLADIAAAA
ncbi:MAG TPA: hypothetical protein VGO48_07630 [Conexibacter sp.]|nr:hypothetical protein [Conexibacter sp.]